MLAIGVDIGGTNTKIGAVSSKGKCLDKRFFKTQDYNDSESYYLKIVFEINEVLALFSDCPVSGIGIGAPGVDERSGVLRSTKNIQWLENFDLVARLSDYFDLQVFITNDANAAAMGEWKFGIGRNFKNFILLTLGTGLGGAIMINGQLVKGFNGMAGELGHMNVDRKGRICNCGKRGCLETYVSATGIINTTMELLKERELRSELYDIPSQDLSGKEVLRAAMNGDSLALVAFENTGQVLAEKLADLVTVLDPDIIILAGGLANAGEFLLKPTEHYLQKYLSPIYDSAPYIMCSSFRDSTAAILGAASLVLPKSLRYE